MTLWDLGNAIIFWATVAGVTLCALGALIASVLNDSE